MLTNSNDLPRKANDTCFYYRTYSFQADIGNCFPDNFVPQLKPKSTTSCNLSPLKLIDSTTFSLSKNCSDNDEQIRLFNNRRMATKVISLSNASTSTDLPIIELKTSSSMFQHCRTAKCDLSLKPSLKPFSLKKKKSLTILGELRRIKSVGIVNL